METRLTALTHKQQEYIDELADGPKTTRDMVLSLMVCGGSVAAMMLRLRKMGRVKSSKVAGMHGNVWQHELIPIDFTEPETL